MTICYVEYGKEHELFVIDNVIKFMWNNTKLYVKTTTHFYELDYVKSFWLEGKKVER